jgi:ATP phosphoribosyltransferase regulatory subunit
VLQPLSLLLDLAGEAMRARLFVVQGEGAEEQALRPDFTVPVVQAHIASGAMTGRYRYEGKAFLAAERGSHHPTEFLQIGAELFGGSQDAAADDAMIAGLAWSAARSGGRADLSIRLGDPGLLAGYLSALGLMDAARTRLMRAFRSERALAAELSGAGSLSADPEASRLANLLGGMSEPEATSLLEELWRMSGIQPVGGRSASEIVQRLAARSEAARAPGLTAAEANLIERFLSLTGRPEVVLGDIRKLSTEAAAPMDALLDDWSQRLISLNRAGVDEDAMTLSTGFIRGFGYYDGMLFEIHSAALAPDQPVAGGGRYDALPLRLGGARGAVGCMVRPGRAALAAGGR